jgi:hypothetical protein
MHVADHEQDSHLPSRDPARGGEEEEGKQTRSTVSADTTSKSSDIETIDIEED